LDFWFSKPQRAVISSLRKFNLFLAGVGSGKSYLIGFLSALYLIICPKAVGFIVANTNRQLSQSTLSKVFKAWKLFFNLTEGIDYVVDVIPPKTFDTSRHEFKKNDYLGVISMRWGAYCFIGSLENAKAHDGKEPAWIMCDETKDSREEDFKEVIVPRARGEGMYIKDGKITGDPTGKKHNPIYVMTSPSRKQWLNTTWSLDDFQDEIKSKIFSKTDFFHKSWENKCAVLSSTWHNIDHVGIDYINDVYSINGKKKRQQANLWRSICARRWGILGRL